MAVPEPGALVALAFGQQTQAHRVVEQLEDKLRRGRVRDAKLFPVHAVVRSASCADAAAGDGSTCAPARRASARDISARAAAAHCATGKNSLPTSASGGWRLKNFTSATEWFSPSGQREAVRERQLLVAVFQMRRQRDDLAVKLQRLAVVAIRGACVWPQRASHWSNSASDKHQRVRAVAAIAVRVGNPLDEFPVVRAETVPARASARTTRSIMSRSVRAFSPVRGRDNRNCTARRWRDGSSSSGWGLANDAQCGARRIQQWQRRGGESQFSSSWTSLHFLLGLLGPGKTVEAGVRLQFRRHGTLGAQEQERQFLQARLALGVQQARPPVRIGKIPARKRKFFEIILQHQPRALRIGARRRNSSGCPRARQRWSWNRTVRGADRRTRRKFATAPCGARRISSCFRRGGPLRFRS